MVFSGAQTSTRPVLFASRCFAALAGLSGQLAAGPSPVCIQRVFSGQLAASWCARGSPSYQADN